MKAKVKFDAKKIKTFFIEHVEKMVLGLFALVALWLMWSYFTLERFTRTPDELQSAAQRARDHVERQTFDAEREGIVFTDPMEMLALANEPLDPEPFRLEPWNPPLFPERKRAEPEIFAVQELEVLTGTGTFRVPRRADDAEAGGGDSTGAFNWACVVGLIPYERQQQAFHVALRRRAETPQWDAYIVQRAAVPAGGNEQPKWETLDMRKVFRQMHELIGQSAASDPVRQDFLLPVAYQPIAYPLPDRVDRQWRLEEVAHSKIIAEMQANDEPAEEAETEEPEPVIDEDNPFGAPVAAGAPPARGGGGMAGGGRGGMAQAGRQPRGGMGQAGQQPRGGGMGQAAGQPRSGGMGRAVQQPRGGGMGQAAGQPRRGGMGQAGQQGGEARAADVPAGPPFRLFRFFDFDVEPGHQYRYRVVLYVKNPNQGVPAQELEDPELAKKRWLTSPPSEVSPAGQIPWGAQLAFGPLVPPRGANDIGVEAIISQRDDRGHLGMIKKKVYRGELINFKSKDASIFSPSGAVETKELAFRTETMVVDIDDGESTARVLVLNPGGRLQVRSNPADFAKADERLQQAKPSSSESQPGDGGGREPRRGGGLGANLRTDVLSGPQARQDD